jgi:hypothetical protein
MPLRHTGVEVKLHAFLTMALDVSGHIHVYPALPLEKERPVRIG